MAGLIQQAAGPQAEQGGEDGFIESENNVGGAPASPEEQKQFDALVEPALAMIHAPEMHERVLAELRQGELSDAIGKLAIKIVLQLKQMVEGKSGEVGESVLLEVGGLVAEELIELAEAAKLMQGQEPGQIFEQAMMVAIQEYGRHTGQVKGVDPNAARQDLEQQLSGMQAGGKEDQIAAAVRQAIGG